LDCQKKTLLTRFLDLLRPDTGGEFLTLTISGKSSRSALTLKTDYSFLPASTRERGAMNFLDCDGVMLILKEGACAYDGEKITLASGVSSGCPLQMIWLIPSEHTDSKQA